VPNLNRKFFLACVHSVFVFHCACFGDIIFLVLFSKEKIVSRIFSDHLVRLSRDVGQIWRNQAKMHQCPAALTGANEYFTKKIQARRGNAQQTPDRATVVLDTSHFKRIWRVFMRLENFSLT